MTLSSGSHTHEERLRTSIAPGRCRGRAVCRPSMQTPAAFKIDGNRDVLTRHEHVVRLAFELIALRAAHGVRRVGARRCGRGFRHGDFYDVMDCAIRPPSYPSRRRASSICARAMPNPARSDSCVNPHRLRRLDGICHIPSLADLHRSDTVEDVARLTSVPAPPWGESVTVHGP